MEWIINEAISAIVLVVMIFIALVVIAASQNIVNIVEQALEIPMEQAHRILDLLPAILIASLIIITAIPTNLLVIAKETTE